MRRAALRERLGACDEESGAAMLMVVMLIFLLAGLSLAVLASVLAEVRPTQFAQKNTETIYGAQTGVEASMARIRNALGAADFTGKLYGDSRKLPCTVTGDVDESGSGLTYSATVRYFAEDPSGRDESWLSAHEIACTEGGGTGTVLPGYALIVASGDAGAGGQVSADQGDRSISMVYQFETTTQNIAGGRIYSWQSSTSTVGLCLRAASATVGAAVYYRTGTDCGLSTNESLELWIYDQDYGIKLASSTLTSTELCLTKDDAIGSITLQACVTVTDGLGAHLKYTQLWAWHPSGNATWVSQNSAIDNAGTCLKAAGRTSGNPVNGDRLEVGTCANQAAWGSFSPDPAVGPGAASVNTHQIVNYLEFGRCFDVTDTDVAKAFMIAYPCKQDPPNSAALYWNHKWFYTEPLVGSVASPQLIYVFGSTGTKYCLRTPSATTNPNVTGVGTGWYPTLTSACNATDASQLWTRSTDTGVKTSSYTIKDSSGRCVGVSGMRYLNNWSALVVASCDGSTAQKWNAPADKVEAQTGNYLEEN